MSDHHDHDHLIVGAQRRKGALGIATPATSKPWSLSHHCPAGQHWMLPGEKECRGCQIERGERHGYPTLAEMGLAAGPVRKTPVQRPPSRIPFEPGERAITLHRAGQTAAQIAEQLGVSRHVIAQWVKHLGSAR